MCTSVGTLQNNHENNSVEQKHSKREHHILLWIKMTTHLWDSNNKDFSDLNVSLCFETIAVKSTFWKLPAVLR